MFINNHLRLNCFRSFRTNHLQKAAGYSYFFSSSGHNNSCSITLSSLENQIVQVWPKLSDLFPSLTNEKVLEIAFLVKTGKYKFSSLEALLLKHKDNKKRLFYELKVYFLLNDNIGGPYYAYLQSSESDMLVSTAIAYLLNRFLIDDGVLPRSSYSYRMKLSSYYKLIGSSSNTVRRLYYLEVKKSILSVSKSDILKKISSIVSDEGILDLLYQFVHMPVFYTDTGGATRDLPMKNIPLFSFLSKVLENLYYIDFDQKLAKELGGDHTFSRYADEVLVYHHYNGCIPNFAEVLKNLLRSDPLFKDVIVSSIGCGDGASLSCYNGYELSLSESGLIKVVSNKIESDESSNDESSNESGGVSNESSNESGGVSNESEKREGKKE